LKYKLSILEPWESGTECAIEVSVVQETEEGFLLFSEIPIITEHGNAQYFNCALKNEEDRKQWKDKIKGTYPMRMVFDKNIKSAEGAIPNLKSYRSNFLSGELKI
jgi:hypothetical protein